MRTDFLVYSNLVFLLPAIRAASRGLMTRFVFNALVPFTSGGYHACRTGTTCIFGLPYPVFHATDFVVAQMAIPLSALYLVHWGAYAWLERIFILGFLTGMILAVVQGASSFLAQGIIAGISIGIVLVYWAGYAITSYWDKGRPAFPRYDWGALLAGISYTGIAIGLFQLQNRLPMEWYWIIHSAWHIMAALGQWFILAVKEPDKDAFYRALDAQIVPDQMVGAIMGLDDKHEWWDDVYADEDTESEVDDEEEEDEE